MTGSSYVRKLRHLTLYLNSCVFGHSTPNLLLDSGHFSPIDGLLQAARFLDASHEAEAELKPFLAKKGHPADEVERMYAAWVKSCLLQVTLWSHPHVTEGDF